MKDDQKILVAACAFAVFLVGQKKGWFKPGAAPVYLGASNVGPLKEAPYDPENPGNFDLSFMRTPFDKGYEALGLPGFYTPGLFR